MTGSERRPDRVEPNRELGRLPHVIQPDAVAVDPPPLDRSLELVETVEQVPFHQFYVAARDRVGRALALTLGDADLAADCVDEAMARAYQRWSSVQSMDNPTGWVYRVGLNVARSRLRRVGRWIGAGRDAHTADSVRDPAPMEPAVVRALDELSVDHRAVVVCRLLLGWSEAETAAALHVRPGTVKSRLHRALAVLEPKLAHLRPEGRP